MRCKWKYLGQLLLGDVAGTGGTWHSGTQCCCQLWVAKAKPRFVPRALLVLCSCPCPACACCSPQPPWSEPGGTSGLTEPELLPKGLQHQSRPAPISSGARVLPPWSHTGFIATKRGWEEAWGTEGHRNGFCDNPVTAEGRQLCFIRHKLGISATSGDCWLGWLTNT